jgi:hypothetical protein
MNRDTCFKPYAVNVAIGGRLLRLAGRGRPARGWSLLASSPCRGAGQQEAGQQGAGQQGEHAADGVSEALHERARWRVLLLNGGWVSIGARLCQLVRLSCGVLVVCLSAEGNAAYTRSAAYMIHT